MYLPQTFKKSLKYKRGPAVSLCIWADFEKDAGYGYEGLGGLHDECWG